MSRQNCYILIHSDIDALSFDMLKSIRNNNKSIGNNNSYNIDSLMFFKRVLPKLLQTTDRLEVLNEISSFNRQKQGRQQIEFFLEIDLLSETVSDMLSNQQLNTVFKHVTRILPIENGLHTIPESDLWLITPSKIPGERNVHSLRLSPGMPFLFFVTPYTFTDNDKKDVSDILSSYYEKERNNIITLFKRLPYDERLKLIELLSNEAKIGPKPIDDQVPTDSLCFFNKKN